MTGRLAVEGIGVETAVMRTARPTGASSRQLSKNPWTWIALATLGFGGSFPLSKALLDSGVDVWQLFAPRYVIAAIVIVTFITRRRRVHRANRNRGVALGVINVAVPTVFLTFATDLLPASVAGILAAFIPVTTIAFAHSIVPGERFVVRRLPGVAVAVVGAAILVTGSRAADGSALSLLGVVLGVAGVASAGLGGAMNRRFAMRIPAVELAGSQFVAAAVALVVVSAPLGGLNLGGFDVIQWFGLVVMAVVSTAVPFYSILKAAEFASAATVANIGYLVPIVAAGGSILFLGDPVTGAFASGAVMIVVGVWLSDRLAGSTPQPMTF
jgi:drug/metabolite transporter (DMT)-like permease